MSDHDSVVEAICLREQLPKVFGPNRTALYAIRPALGRVATSEEDIRLLKAPATASG